MGIMKRELLFSIILAIFLTIPVRASVTVEETTDPEILINSGYSQSLVEDVFMVKNRANSRPVEPLYEKSQHCVIKAWRKFYAYLDPAADNEDRLHHDIKRAPSYSDL